VYTAIKEKCSEYRSRTQTVQDEFIDDVTMFLEQQLMSDTMGQDRESRIQRMGRAKLIAYVQQM
jgi:hypothetical protein